MYSCFNIALCAVGNLYVEMTKVLLRDVRKLNDIKIYLLTDQVSSFNDINNIDIIEFKKPKFSYHDQLIVAKKSLEENDCVLLIDADHKFSSGLKINVTCDSFECGCYPELSFDDEFPWSMRGFLNGENKDVPYGKEFKQFCQENGYITDGVKHIQESFLLIKETNYDKKKKLFDAWENLSTFCNKKDEDRGRKVLGAGEGYSLSVALTYADMKIQNNIEYRNLLENFQHLRNEKNFLTNLKS
jgi:hypothetical protein